MCCRHKGDDGMTVRDVIRDRKTTEKWKFILRNEIHVHKLELLEEEGDGKRETKITSLTTVNILHTNI